MGAEEKGLTVAEKEPSSMLEVIARAVADPRCDVAKMEKLLDLQERIMDVNRKQVFASAMARLQAKLPQIRKGGRIVVKGQERSRFARHEDLDDAVRPLLAEFGFSFSFDEESAEGNNRRYSAKLAHEDGHSETKHITLPLDVSDYRSGCQSAGSTNAYARRYLTKMHLNIVERDEDTDGNDVEFISEEQARDLVALADEVKADKARFLAYMGADAFASILVRDLQKAITALERKRA